MKKIFFLFLLPFFCVINNSLTYSQCTDGSFIWDTNATWNIDDMQNTYTIPHAGGMTTVMVEIIDPLNRNGDNDQYTTHPFDPAMGCLPYPGAGGASEIDDTPGDGSITDPWDSDCNFLYTESNGVFGSGYLSFSMNTEVESDFVTLKYTFSDPVILTNFTVSDVDATGFYNAVSVGRSEYETPGDSYQDEIILGAVSSCGGPADLTLTGGANIILAGDTARALYELGTNNNVGGNDPVSMVQVSTTEAITELTLTYSNGFEDAVAEQTYPELYEWWSLANGATNGASDDQAIRVDNLDFCVCNLPITVAGGPDVCDGESITLDATASGGTAPYTYEWLDGATSVGTGASVTLSPTATTTYTVMVTDANCCMDETTVTINVIDCCPAQLCLPVTVTVNN